MKDIGPNFPNELKIVGLGDGLVYTIGGTDEDIQGRESLSESDNNILQTVIDDHDPADLDPGPSVDEVYDQAMLNNKLLKAIVLSINDGSLVTGANVSGAELKTIIKAKL